MSSGVHPAPFGARSAFPLSRSESRLHKDPKLAGAIRMATPKTGLSGRQAGPDGLDLISNEKLKNMGKNMSA